MIHAAVFPSTDPAARSTLLVAGSPQSIALNTPPGGCWREVPAGCTSAADVPALGAVERLGATAAAIPSPPR